MAIERIILNDLEQIKNLQPKGWSDIIPDIKFYIESTFCTPIKATIDDKIIGIGVLITFENTSWIAHIIVDSTYRNKGIGSQIVNELLKKVKQSSIETCSLIATDLGKLVYLKTGFRTVTDYTFLQKEKQFIDCSVSKNIVSFEEKYRKAIYDLDRLISGENRTILLKDFLHSSILYIESKNVIGYYIPTLKEGPIVANSVYAGIELMKFKYSKIDKAVLPSENIEGLDFLKKMGFVETSKVTRMTFGKDLEWNPHKIFSRIAGSFG